MLDVSLPVQQLMPIALLISDVWRRQLLRISVMADEASTPGSREVVFGRPQHFTSSVEYDTWLKWVHRSEKSVLWDSSYEVHQVKWSENLSVVSHSLRPLPGSSVHGILQAIILEWVAVPFCRGSSQPRDRTQVSYIAGKFFTIWATREACEVHKLA